MVALAEGPRKMSNEPQVSFLDSDVAQIISLFAILQCISLHLPLFYVLTLTHNKQLLCFLENVPYCFGYLDVLEVHELGASAS